MNSYGNERLATPNSQPVTSIRVESTTAQAAGQDEGTFDDDHKYPRLFGTATVHASSACRSIAYTADYLRKFLDELKANTWRISSVELAVGWLDEAAAELRKIDDLYKGSMVPRREEATPHA